MWALLDIERSTAYARGMFTFLVTVAIIAIAVFAIAGYGFVA